LVVYSGTRFPQFQGRLLLGALASRMVAQVRINPKNGLLAEEARLLTGLKARIRDARESPDGHIYLLTDESPGHLLRIVPPGS
jgi:aldose sugar dehydrogenase